MMEPDAPRDGPRWPFKVYQRIGWWAMDVGRELGHMRVTDWTWRLWAWTIRRRNVEQWAYEREQTAVLVLASLLVGLAVWWIVGAP